MRRLVFFDLETGGLEESHPVIQLAAIAVSPNWEELAVYERKLLFPVADADPKALAMNCYRKDVWEREAIHPLSAIDQFAMFLEPYRDFEMVSKRTGNPFNVCRLAGYNAQTFDGPRLRRLFNGRFLAADPRVLDVMQLAMWWIEVSGARLENLKLGTVCKHFGIEIEGAHDALADVRATVRLAQCLIAEQKERAAA